MQSRRPTVLVRYSRTTPTPWANGRGITSELISWDSSRPLSAGTVAPWRLSIAQLAGEAAFSPLPDARRMFLPVGTGVTLVVNGVARRVPDRTMTSFNGGDDVELVELDPRPGWAINLMYRPGQAGSAVGIVLGDTRDPTFRNCLAAVALERSGEVDRFDVLAPAPVDASGIGMPVAMIFATGHPAR